jgi:methylmalonyl-CoA mutase N-terminal domain/subunit
VDTGLRVEAVAPRIAFVFDAQSDFFEEIAKYRAARKLWAEAMRDRFGVKDAQSCQLRCHVRTAQASVTAEQPYNNVVRTALQAMAAVLGGTTSLHTNAFDEAVGTATANAATIALRTQQIIAHESGVTRAADPLGGAYFVEALTHQLETAVRGYWATIDGAGGMAVAIAQAYPQREIASAAASRSEAAARRDHVIVGVNDFVQNSEAPAAPRADDGAEAVQVERLIALRAARNQGAVQRGLESLRQTARGTGNTMPALLECVRAYATLGEMCGTLREVWGS